MGVCISKPLPKPPQNLSPIKEKIEDEILRQDTKSKWKMVKKISS